MMYYALCEMKNIQRYFVLGAVFLGVLGSCSDDVDFDQANDLEVSPVLEGPVAFVEAPEFLINQVAPGISFYSEEFNFDAFSSDFFSERVIEGLITYEIENSTSKELDVVVDLVDEMGNVLDTESFLIDRAVGSVFVLERQIFYGPGGRSIDIIKNTSGIRVSATNLGDNITVSPISPQKIFLRSSGEFRIELIK